MNTGNNNKLFSELRSTLLFLQDEKKRVLLRHQYGIITPDGVSIELMNIKEKEYKLKKQIVAQVHICQDGAARKYEYKESKNLWMTIMPDKSKVYGKTEEILIDKILTYYGVSTLNYTFYDVFEEALAHKDRTESVNQDTLYHLRSTYNRFISQDLGHTPIKSITCDFLSEYTLSFLRGAQEIDEQGVTVKIKKKAFLDYKSVLNVIFDYALEKDIITVNPLTKFKNKAFFKECDCSKAVSEDKIFSKDEICLIQTQVRKYMKYPKYHGYFINGYAILLSIETGMRAAEIPALKWSDVKSNYIHIHSQQLSNKRKGGKEYYLADWTKDEKGVSNGGRKFPLSDTISDLLMELKNIQQAKGIYSDYIFCHENGEWIKKDAYTTCLRRMLSSMGFKVTNNHAFRMSLNSNVLADELNLPVAKRAQLLGHSIETNLKYYTYAEKSEMDDLVSLFNNMGTKVSPKSHPNVIKFEKKESLESSKFKAFS